MNDKIIEYVEWIELKLPDFNLNQINIPETYRIGIILGFITFVLWCLLKYKKIKQQNVKNLNNSTSSSVNSSGLTNSGKKQHKPGQQHQHQHKQQKGFNSSNDDGYLSDSALSFLVLSVEKPDLDSEREINYIFMVKKCLGLFQR